MDTFKKYGSIDNSYQRKLLDKYRLYGFDKKEVSWVLLEKVHGSNFSATIVNNEVIWGKRTSFLKTIEEQKDFNDSDIVVKKYSGCAKSIYQNMVKLYPDVESVHIYGELYGGIYPGYETDKFIQKGIYYSSNIDFIVFDICYSKIITVENEMKESVDKLIYTYLDHTDVVSICDGLNMPVLKPIKTGTFDEILSIDPDTFESEIYLLHNLPKIDGNIAEGFVLKPNKTVRMPSGSRCIVKNKSKGFAEMTHVKVKTHKKSTPLSPETIAAIDTSLCYVTKARIGSVESKLGKKEKDNMRKLTGIIVSDAMKDIKKDHPDLINKKNKKSIGTALYKTIFEMLNN